ncbi:MAG: hypothetical protein HAW67_02815 [Endozoicomonadaceae bacterium]|nr:hypothetical protein [Endozoicomonadaceae bacterium]
MSDDLHELTYKERPRLEQDRMLQALYDKGYNVSSIAKKLQLNQQTVYSRIDAHRGRSKALNA